MQKPQTPISSTGWCFIGMEESTGSFLSQTDSKLHPNEDKVVEIKQE
jgi:hypothetical protein